MSNPTETAAFKQLLDQLSEELGNAGCNDFEIPNSEEGRAFEREVNDDFHGENNYEPTEPDETRIILHDQAVLTLLAKRLGITLD